jgi:hypothetical protein
MPICVSSLFFYSSFFISQSLTLSLSFSMHLSVSFSVYLNISFFFSPFHSLFLYLTLTLSHRLSLLLLLRPIIIPFKLIFPLTCGAISRRIELECGDEAAGVSLCAAGRGGSY